MNACDLASISPSPSSRTLSKT